MSRKELPPLEAHTGTYFIKTIHNDTYPFIDPLKSTKAHTSHSVFITGASKGMGRCIALAFAQSGVPKIALGARSSLDTLESEILNASAKGRHPAPQIVKIQLDVTDKDNVKRAAQEVEKAFGEGGVDILVNNAGFIETGKPMGEIDVDDWWHTWEVNVRGMFLVTHAFLPLVLKSKEKTIVNVSSNGAHWILAGYSAYQTGKLAILRLTEFMNVDHGAQGLLAYAVHPGSVLTEMGYRLSPEIQAVLNDKPEMAGDTIAFLTRERRDWLAGRYISCTWDMEEFLSKKDEVVNGDKLKVRMVV